MNIKPFGHTDLEDLMKKFSTTLFAAVLTLLLVCLLYTSRCV